MRTLIRSLLPARVNVISAISILLAALALAACNSSASSEEINVSQFSVELKGVLSELSSRDIFKLRRAISKIPLTHDPHAERLLVALWDGEEVPGISMDLKLLQNPIVRSKIAHGLISLGNQSSKYADYVKQLARDNDLTVQIVGLEALRDIDEPESMDLLSRFSSHPNPRVSEIAIAGIRHFVDYGQHQDYAAKLWGKIKKDPSIDQSIVQQYDKMYGDYKEKPGSEHSYR